MSQELTASLEDYLEAIYQISRTEPNVRSMEISKHLSVNKASVTGAMRALKERGLINYAPYQKITLTDEGMKLAINVVRRHELLKSFMSDILLADEKDAEEAACQMEHSVTPAILERFLDFMEFMNLCPRMSTDWKGLFSRYRETKEVCNQCDACLLQMRAELARRNELEEAAKEMQFSLLDLQPGHVAVVKASSKDRKLKKKMKEIGVSDGEPVYVEMVGSLGDKIEVKVRGFHLKFSRTEAKKIPVELK